MHYPSWMWAFCWTVSAFGLLGATLRFVKYRNAPNRRNGLTAMYLVVAVLFALLAIFKPIEGERPEHPAIAARRDHDLKYIFDSQTAIATVESATRVRAYRLPHTSAMVYETPLDENKIEAGPVDVSAADAVTLKEILLDPSTYDWDWSCGRIAEYRVRLQFATDRNKVDVMLSFDDHMIWVYEDGKAKPFNGQEEDFKAGRFEAVLRRIFPDDKEIQAWTDSRTAD